MQKPTASLLFRPALLCAALALGAGCASTKPRADSPTDSTPPAQDTRSTATPESSTPQPPPTGQAASPWQRARVGDRVTYSFSANRTPVGSARGESVAGVVTVEVVAVEAPWAWLTLTFAGDGGAPLAQPSLARSLVLPMRMDVTRPLEVAREGEESAEQSTAAGRTWEARRYINDRRPADGPLENRLYAVDPGPLYLTNGLLDASTTLSGFGASGGSQLTLVEARQGSADAGPGTRPGLERPLGPGTWYEERGTSGVGQAPFVRRTCEGAERGHVLRQITPPKPGAEACPDFARAEEVHPLEEVILNLAEGALEHPQWPPPQPGAAPAVRETLTAGEHQVPVLRFDTPETVAGARGVVSRMFASDPWDGSLAGLAHWPRFQQLAYTAYVTPKPGRREPVDGMALADWGTWVPGAKP